MTYIGMFLEKKKAAGAHFLASFVDFESVQVLVNIPAYSEPDLLLPAPPCMLGSLDIQDHFPKS